LVCGLLGLVETFCGIVDADHGLGEGRLVVEVDDVVIVAGGRVLRKVGV
jgi:hypothetical protein